MSMVAVYYSMLYIIRQWSYRLKTEGLFEPSDESLG